jgi:hypothetical protein
LIAAVSTTTTASSTTNRPISSTGLEVIAVSSRWLEPMASAQTAVTARPANIQANTRCRKPCRSM